MNGLLCKVSFRKYRSRKYDWYLRFSFNFSAAIWWFSLTIIVGLRNILIIKIKILSGLLWSSNNNYYCYLNAWAACITIPLHPFNVLVYEIRFIFLAFDSVYSMKCIQLIIIYLASWISSTTYPLSFSYNLKHSYQM